MMSKSAKVGQKKPGGGGKGGGGGGGGGKGKMKVRPLPKLPDKQRPAGEQKKVKENCYFLCVSLAYDF